jgi:phosphatidylinositol alpha-1,6-mannosyltransferase
MRRIVHILTHEFPPYIGGAGVYCYEMGLAASKLGEKIKIWAPVKSVRNEYFDLKDLPWKGSQGILTSWKLVTEIKNFIPSNDTEDIFHLAELGSSRAFLRFGWMIREKIKIILTIHGSEILRFTRNPIEKWLFRKLLQRSVKIHVLSKFNKQKLTEFCPSVEHSICLIPGAPSSSLRDNRSSFNQLNGKNKIQILCVGRIHPRKGQDQILLALKSLPKEQQNKIVIRFAGPKTKPKFFEKLSKISNGFAGKVIFEGDCTDFKLRKLYNSSDIFALTSMPVVNSIEGFGFVYLEASSYGLPIIANQTGGVEDAVIKGKTGLLAQPGDLKELSQLLNNLVNDEKLRERLGKEGQKWAKKHTWEKVAKTVYNFS